MYTSHVYDLNSNKSDCINININPNGQITNKYPKSIKGIFPSIA